MSLEPVRIEKYSCDVGVPIRGIPHLKLKNCRVLTLGVSGEAPKDLLAIYEYERGVVRHNRPYKWPVYIAKVGDKWYPSESITEYALNRIGERIGLNMAKSRLLYVRGQLRFLSLNFRHPDEVLEHGAEILAGYLGDREFVDMVEEKKESRNLFTVQVVYDSLKHVYPDCADTLFKSFLELLAFDALIGNNDRHMYNWGVLKHVKTGAKRFSPIFDTARALHWNKSDQVIDLMLDKPNNTVSLVKYARESKPKTGWDGIHEIGHFELIRQLVRSFPEHEDAVRNVVSEDAYNSAIEVLEEEIAPLVSQNRLSIMRMTLLARLDAFKKLGIL